MSFLNYCFIGDGVEPPVQSAKLGEVKPRLYPNMNGRISEAKTQANIKMLARSAMRASPWGGILWVAANL